MTLRARLTAAFILVVLVPLVVVIVLVTTALPSAVAERQERGLSSSGRLAAAVLEQVCSRVRVAAVAAGRATPELSRGRPAEVASLRTALQTLVDGGLVDGVRVLDVRGRTLGSAGLAPDVPSGGDCTTGQVVVTQGTAQVVAAVGLERASGSAGRAVAAVSIDDALATDLAMTAGSGQVVLLEGGRVLARSGPVSDELVRAALRAPGLPVQAGSDLAVLETGQPLQPVAVLLVQPTGEGVDVLPVALVLLVGAVSLAAVIALLLARATTKPLEELGDAAERFAAGDLSGAIEVRAGDEVGRLASTFNTMTDELRSHVGALQDSRDELQAGVVRLGEALAGTHDLDRILTVVLAAAVASTRARAGAVLLLSGDRSALDLAVGQGLDGRGVADPLRLPLGSGVAGRVASAGEPLCGRIGPGRLQPAPGEPTGDTVIAVPLTSSTTVIGVLLLLDRQDGEEFDDRDLATLRTFTGQATVAVDNVLLHEEARRMSLTDGLTGLWNFRYFQMTVGKEIERASRFDRPLGLLMLDIDHFKLVNDRYGHQRGDAVLIELAARVRGLVRDVDTVARYGGEELVVVLPETDVQGAARAAERICEAVRGTAFGAPGEPSVPVTVSVGGAVFPVHGTTVASLLHAADDALYVAKRGGRDVWRMAPGSIAPAPS